MIYEKNCVDGFVGRRFTCCAVAALADHRASYRQGVKMRSNKIDGSYEIADMSLKATAMTWRATGGVSTGSPIRSQQRRTNSGQGRNSGVVRQFTRQSPGG
jgi:hypothetical protein